MGALEQSTGSNQHMQSSNNYCRPLTTPQATRLLLACLRLQRPSPPPAGTCLVRRRTAALSACLQTVQSVRQEQSCCKNAAVGGVVPPFSKLACMARGRKF